MLRIRRTDPVLLLRKEKAVDHGRFRRLIVESRVGEHVRARLWHRPPYQSGTGPGKRYYPGELRLWSEADPPEGRALSMGGRVTAALLEENREVLVAAFGDRLPAILSPRGTIIMEG